MHFPVEFHVLGLKLHAHFVFEALGYAIGFQTYRILRKRRNDEKLDVETFLWVLAGCITGAMLGSKLLAWAESWPEYRARWGDVVFWMGGKTIVGGLIGGWIGVEIVKRILRVRVRTGDLYVVPLCVGMAIGRVGCFLSGLDDHTHGVATSLPWAVDFGDGVRRHPAQLYEILVLVVIAVATSIGIHRLRLAAGTWFRLFVLSYMLWRFGVEFIKPSWKGYAGLSAIQWASLLTAIVALLQIVPLATGGRAVRNRPAVGT